MGAQDPWREDLRPQRPHECQWLSLSLSFNSLIISWMSVIVIVVVVWFVIHIMNVIGGFHCPVTTKIIVIKWITINCQGWQVWRELAGGDQPDQPALLQDLLRSAKGWAHNHSHYMENVNPPKKNLLLLMNSCRRPEMQIYEKACGKNSDRYSPSQGMAIYDISIQPHKSFHNRIV